MMDADPEGFKLEQEDLAHWAYEYAYKDGRINVSSLVNDLEIPTIGIINGPGFHTEMCLMCDITICADDAIIYDLHYDIGSVPGDGIHSCFQEMLGVKRAAYALLTGQAIDAKTALEYGMVNEVHAARQADRARLQDRRPHHDAAAHHPAHDDADRAASVAAADHRQPRRRLRHPDVRASGEGRAGARPRHIADQVAYVRKGKRNNFD